jgi:hypothetical protein
LCCVLYTADLMSKDTGYGVLLCLDDASLRSLLLFL